MEAAPPNEMKAEFQPTEDDDFDVVIVQYDLYKAPSDSDFMTRPFKFDSLEDVGSLPEKTDIDRTVLHQDGRMWDFEDLMGAENPPDWFKEDEG